jgi:undecaprenyl-diphosphatase
MLETLRHIDHSLFHFVNHDLANPVLDLLCPVFRNKLTWLPLYVILALLFYKKYGRQVLWLAAFAALTILLTDQLSSSLIKPLTHRLRPCNNPEVNARLLLDYCGAGYSFVSSHAANHFGIAAFLLPFVQRKVLFGSLLFVWAALVSFSQVYVGVHFPADVLGGAILGSVIGALLFYPALWKIHT